MSKSDKALVDYSGTNPLNYDVKYAQDTQRQVANPFRTGVFNQSDIRNMDATIGQTTATYFGAAA